MVIHVFAPTFPRVPTARAVSARPACTETAKVVPAACLVSRTAPDVVPAACLVPRTAPDIGTASAPRSRTVAPVQHLLAPAKL